MSGTPVSAIVTLLHTALDLVQDNSCGSLAPVCRCAVYLGGEVPMDSCETSCGNGRNGMLWANLVGVNQIPQAGDGPCQAWTWTAQIGVYRCVAVLGADGSIPSKDAIEADSTQQAADADAIYAALVCCVYRPETLRDVTLSSWAPVSPQGGCAGGSWTVTGRLEDCCG